MEAHLVPAHRGCVSRQRLLLAVSLLTIWMSSAAAEMTIEVTPPNPVEGNDVNIIVRNLPIDTTVHFWYIGRSSIFRQLIVAYEKDTKKNFPGPAFTGQETIIHSSSLLIRNITRKHTGYYIFQVMKPFYQTEEVFTWLRVHYGPDTPLISPSYVFYPPGASVNLSCYADSDPPAEYTWLVNGKVQKPSRELFIPNISQSVDQSYTCYVYNSVTRLHRTADKTFAVKEPVSTPSIRASKTTAKENETVVLVCTTDKSQVSFRWFHNNKRLKLTERMKLMWDDHILTINSVRKEDAGEYHCTISNQVTSIKSEPVKLNVY